MEEQYIGHPLFKLVTWQSLPLSSSPIHLIAGQESGYRIAWSTFSFSYYSRNWKQEIQPISFQVLSIRYVC
jgi:hypothetical protein